MDHNETYHRIESFLNNQMDEGQKELFEKEMTMSEQLQQEVNLHKLANDLVLKNRLLQVSQISTEIKNKSTQKLPLKRPFQIGLILLTAGLSTYLFFNHKDTSSDNTDRKELTSNSKAWIPTNIKEAEPSADKSEISPDKNSIQKPLKETASKTSEIKTETRSKETAAIVDLDNKPLESNPTEGTHLKTETPKVDPCKNTILTASITTSLACEGSDNGIINVSDIKGGKGSHKVKVLNHATQREEMNTLLPKGTYDVVISDQNSCIKKIENISITEKPCDVDYQFNPVLGETWEVPTSNYAAELIIMSQNGTELFKKTIPAHENWAWDGKSSSGEIESGVFVYLLKYSNHSIKKGSLTLLK